jgi:hypothetical protein
MPTIAGGTELLEAQIETFMEENPDIVVEYLYVPSGELLTYVQTQVVLGGSPPDVTAMPYNQLAALQQQGLLATLPDQAQTDDFLQEAIDFATIDDQLYGLPWWRNACLSYYENLVLFDASQEPDAAFELMDFLTQDAQQIENYLDLSPELFPTRNSIYSTQGITCPTPTGQTVLLEPEFVSPTVTYVDRFWPGLQPVLEGQTIDPSEATALLDAEGNILAAAAPQTNNYSDAEFAALLDVGVVIGALSVNADGFLYPIGDYAVKCQGVENTQCELKPPQGNALSADIAFVVPAGGPVLQPFAALKTGSWEFCFPLDGREICIRF